MGLKALSMCQSFSNRIYYQCGHCKHISLLTQKELIFMKIVVVRSPRILSPILRRFFKMLPKKQRNSHAGKRD